MAETTITITDGGMVLIPVWEYEELVRDSEIRYCRKLYPQHEVYGYE